MQLPQGGEKKKEQKKFFFKEIITENLTHFWKIATSYPGSSTSRINERFTSRYIIVKNTDTKDKKNFESRNIKRTYHLQGNYNKELT